MSPKYVAESRLRSMMLKLIRTHAASVIDLRLEAKRGPYLPGNWCVDWLNVLAEDYGAARDFADTLPGRSQWIMVPNGHQLDGLSMGSPHRI